MRADWQMDWVANLWGRLSDVEVRNIVEGLPEELQARIVCYVNREALRRLGWKEVCSGCGKPTAGRDCGCPCGTGMTPPKD
jgi:hypothetical protein